MADEGTTFGGIHIFVRDMAATIAFYQLLGVNVDQIGDHFARATMPNGLSIEFGTAQLSKFYDPGWREPSGVPASALQFRLASRQAVDDMFATLTAAGHKGHLPPFDAYWGSRYAEIDDPNGNIVGLQSPRDPEKSGPQPPF